jgi:hypothetical protein
MCCILAALESILIVDPHLQHISTPGSAQPRQHVRPACEAACEAASEAACEAASEAASEAACEAASEAASEAACEAASGASTWGQHLRRDLSEFSGGLFGVSRL